MRPIFSTFPLVLFYHGVTQHGVLNANAFERQIVLLKRQCTFIRPDEYATVQGVLQRPRVLLTFDDGLRNNADVVAPILRRHGIPALFFVSSRHCTPGRYLWFNYLKMLGSYFPGEGVTLRGKYFWLRARNRGAVIEELMKFLLALEPHPQAMCTAIDSELPRLDEFVRDAVLKDQCEGMTPEQVLELGNDPLFTIGGHSLDHPYLPRCSAAEAQRQISANKTWLERVTGKPCRLFAYPLGAFNQLTIEQCRGVGFVKAFGVERNPISDPLFGIPRVGIYSSSLLPLVAKLWFGHWLPYQSILRVHACTRKVRRMRERLEMTVEALFDRNNHEQPHRAYELLQLPTPPSEEGEFNLEKEA